MTFTNSTKEDLALWQKQCFEDKKVRVPADRKVRSDLHAVKKLTTSAGNTRYDASRDELGHADRFWASALALHAGRHDFAGPVKYESVSKKRVSRYGEGY